MGPSGSGKTTLLNLIAGIDTPTRGADHRRRPATSRRCREGELARLAVATRRLHLPALQPDAGPDRVRERRAAAAADEALEGGAPRARRDGAARSSGLEDRMDHYPRQLSGGQEQRVAIARAIVDRPDDPRRRRADRRPRRADRATRSCELLERLNEEFGKTIVMVTHDPKAAARARTAWCTSTRACCTPTSAPVGAGRTA